MNSWTQHHSTGTRKSSFSILLEHLWLFHPLKPPFKSSALDLNIAGVCGEHIWVQQGFDHSKPRLKLHRGKVPAGRRLTWHLQRQLQPKTSWNRSDQCSAKEWATLGLTRWVQWDWFYKGGLGAELSGKLVCFCGIYTVFRQVKTQNVLTVNSEICVKLEISSCFFSLTAHRGNLWAQGTAGPESNRESQPNKMGK